METHWVGAEASRTADRIPSRRGRYWNGILQPYLKVNLVGFKIGRTDWEYISNCFVIFAKQGFLFDDFGNGPGNALVTQSGSDIGPVAVQVNKTQTHAGVQFSNCQFMSTVRIGPHNTGPVKTSNSGFWVIKETLEQVVNEGSGTVILNGCHFRDWDLPGQGAPCIRANHGRLILSQCDFSRSPTSLIVAPQKKAVSLEPGLVAGTVVGCLFHSDTAPTRLTQRWGWRRTYLNRQCQWRLWESEF